MRTRRAYVDLIWNGAAVAGKMSGYQKDVTYTDPASGEADSIDVSIHDRAVKWIGQWFPETGDTLAATIKAMDWAGPGDTRILPCGSFVLDNFNFSGWPIAGTISGVSVPADSSFRETERSKTWENVTVEEIGKEIAGRAGVALSYNVEGGPIQIKTIEQSERTDCDFYMELCSTYGLAMKVYSKKIVVFDRIRENMGRVKKDRLSGLVNDSIRQSFTRSMNTSISTLLLLLALFFFGGQTTRIFVLAMIIGVVAGTYSSLCIASPIWYEFKMHAKGNRINTK